MRKSLIVTYIVLLPMLSFAQVGRYHYGGAGNQYGYRIKPVKDGGFIVGGSTDSNIDVIQQYWVMRFDKAGTPLWDSGYGNPGGNNLWSIEPTADNGALLAGYSGPQYQNSEALMYKIDSVGRVVKKLEVDYALADHSHWFKQLRDGHYYWAGHTDSKDDPSGDMIMQKLDSNFNLIWEKTYDNGSAEHCHTAAVTPDDGCILLGHTTINNHEKFFAVRVDTAGSVIWKKTYSSDPANNDSPYDVAVTTEGNYAFFGYSGDYSTVSSQWLLVVDSNGSIVLDKHYNLDVSFTYGGIQSSDSGFVLAGYSLKPGSSDTHLYVVKTGKKGELQWQRTFGDSTWGYDVMQRGKQYIVVGGTDQTMDHLDDLWIVVLDSAGNPAQLDTGSVKDTLKAAKLSGLRLNGNPHLKQIGNALPLLISWIQTGDVKTSVDVSVSLDGGANWSKIQTVAPQISSITWSSTPISGYYPACLVRVTSTSKPDVFVQSDSFVIGSSGGVVTYLSDNEYSVSNHPNPFSNTTIISFSLPSSQHVTLEIFNELGEKISTLLDRNEEVGSHFIRLSSKDFANGTYFYKFTTSEGSVMKRMVVNK